MHRRLVADCARKLSITEQGVFVRALITNRQLDSTHITETAVNHYEDYKVTGNAPEYVQDYCLDKLNESRKQRRALATRVMASDPAVSLVSALADGDPPRCPEQVGQSTFFEDGA